MKVRGQAAFSLSTAEGNDIVQMHAELLHGAQLNRSDGLIFSRDAQIETPDGCFKGTLKAILDLQLASKYLKSLKRTTAKAASLGASISIASGQLEIVFPATPADREHWIKARSGNSYTVTDFWLALGDPERAFGSGDTSTRTDSIFQRFLDLRGATSTLTKPIPNLFLSAHNDRRPMLTISKPLSGGQARTYHAREFASENQNY